MEFQFDITVCGLGLVLGRYRVVGGREVDKTVIFNFAVGGDALRTVVDIAGGKNRGNAHGKPPIIALFESG